MEARFQSVNVVLEKDGKRVQGHSGLVFGSHSESVLNLVNFHLIQHFSDDLGNFCVIQVFYAGPYKYFNVARKDCIVKLVSGE